MIAVDRGSLTATNPPRSWKMPRSGAVSVGGAPEVGVVGHGQAVLTQPGGPDVVRIRGHGENAAAQYERHHCQAHPDGSGQQERQDDHEDGADRQDYREMPEHGPAPPARIGQLMPHPVHVLRGEPEPEREPQPATRPGVAGQPDHDTLSTAVGTMAVGTMAVGTMAVGTMAVGTMAVRTTAARAGRIASVFQLADDPAGGYGLAYLDGQPGHRPILMRRERLFHLHRLEDHDRVTGCHPVALPGNDLDDRSLHGAGQVVTVGPARCRPAALIPPLRTLPAAAGTATLRRPAGYPGPRPTWAGRQQAGRQHHLEPLAGHLDGDPLPELGGSG